MITIIGAGKVGGDAALFSALKQLDEQILLLDIAEGLPQGEAMDINHMLSCLLYTSPSPRDGLLSRMPSSA